jgi:multidrug resistance efflux pump
MSELIQRLRSQEAVDGKPHEIEQLTDEAADALAAANFRIAELEAKCRLYEASLDKADTERDALAKDSERYRFLAASAFKHLLPTAETIDAAIAKEPK